MTNITKIAAVENATAIREYDPTRNDNRVLGGSLNVIAAIRTLAIKVKINLLVVRVLLFLNPTDTGIWSTHRIFS